MLTVGDEYDDAFFVGVSRDGRAGVGQRVRRWSCTADAANSLGWCVPVQVVVGVAGVAAWTPTGDAGYVEQDCIAWWQGRCDCCRCDIGADGDFGRVDDTTVEVVHECTASGLVIGNATIAVGPVGWDATALRWEELEAEVNVVSRTVGWRMLVDDVAHDVMQVLPALITLWVFCGG